MSRIILESGSAERMVATIKDEVDPSALTPQFQVTTGDRGTPGGTWVDGSWSQPWDSRTSRAKALSPTVGAAGQIAVDEGTEYLLWMKWGDVIKRAKWFMVR